MGAFQTSLIETLEFELKKLDLSDCNLDSIPEAVSALARISQTSDPLDISTSDANAVLKIFRYAGRSDRLPLDVLEQLNECEDLLAQMRADGEPELEETIGAWLGLLGSLEESVSSATISGEKPASTFGQLALRVSNVTSSGVELVSMAPRLEEAVPKLEGLFRELRDEFDREFLARLMPLAKSFSSLLVLSIADNKLMSLNPVLTVLRELKQLDCSYNLFEKFPGEVLRFERLEVLNLAGNAIRELPTGIAKLPALRELILEENLLEELPSSIGELKNLTYMNLGLNRLSRLPAAVGRLPSLRSLNLEANEYKSFPKNVLACPALTSLSLDGNFISQLPPEIDVATNLKHLSVASAGLRSVPASVSGLKQLTYLDFSNNELTSLPTELARLPETVEIHLEGNPLPETVLQAAWRGTSALFSYLRSLEEETAPCMEAKLVLVGEGNVGKTSIVAALKGEGFVDERPTTHGIELRTVELDVGTNQPLRLNSWDFGGQEIYRVTHQFFFSQEALFLVVWRPREGFEQSGIEFWLKRIWHRVGTRAKVILVSTFADEGRQSHVDLDRLMHLFHPLIVDHCAIDNRSGAGLNDLRVKIALHALKLQHINDPIAARWSSVQSKLKALPSPSISRETFAEFCEESGMDQAATRTWLGMLHELGHVIHFDDDVGLSSTIVLDPELLARAVSYVLEDPNVIESGGILEHSSLERIWAGPLQRLPVPPSAHPFLLRLMERYEISYRLNDRDASLVAPIVPHARPKLPWEPGDPVQQDTAEMALVCRVQGEIPGLIAWLTVRHHRWSTGLHWRDGLFLRNDRQESEALIEEVSTGELSLRVRAPYPVELFSVLRSDIEWLLRERWANLDFDFFVPCGYGPSSARGCGGEFRFADLVRALENGVSKLQCRQCFRERDVRELATGLGTLERHEGDRLAPILAKVSQIERRLSHQAKSARRAEDKVLQAAELTAKVSAAVRELRLAIGQLARDCPRLFTVTPVKRNLRPSQLVSAKYRLRLWCEHPGGEHPQEPAYEFSRRREWLLRAGPMIATMARVLKLLPVVGASAEVVLPARTWRDVAAEVDLMEQLGRMIEAVDLDEVPVTLGSATDEYRLRLLKELLQEVDPPPQKFAGLLRVPGPSGEVLWVCDDHYREYDKGLPLL